MVLALPNQFSKKSLCFLVLPRSRGKYSPSLDKRKESVKEESKEPFYTISDPVFVPREPFPKPRAGAATKVVC